MIQQTLFRMDRPASASSVVGGPTLEMVIEDASTSLDPLEIHLQRKGWKLKTVNSLQESISEKLTVDMFSENIRELSGAEIQLQSDIQDYLDRI